MDSTIKTNIFGVLSTVATYFYGSTPAASYYSGLSQKSDFMGYTGAALAFFLSVGGAYQVGESVITTVEESFWSFLEDFQEDADGTYIALLQDPDLGPQFDDFLTYYGWDFAILTAVNFWHMAFLIGMSIWTAQLIFSKIGEYDRSYGTNAIPNNNGFKLLLFGFIYGAIDYAAGVALSVNQETILKMMSFSPQGGSYTTSTQTTTSDANAGTTTTTTSITKTA